MKIIKDVFERNVVTIIVSIGFIIVMILIIIKECLLR